MLLKHTATVLLIPSKTSVLPRFGASFFRILTGACRAFGHSVSGGTSLMFAQLAMEFASFVEERLSAMSKIVLLVLAAITVLAADNPWSKVRDLKSGSEHQNYKRCTLQSILATNDD